MNREDFCDALHALAPGCTPETAQTWIDFAVERVDEEQYVNFMSTGNREADIEMWLDTLYAGMSAVRFDYGAELTGKLVQLARDRCCLYPGEMIQAAECLADGETADTIRAKIDDGVIDMEPPFFPMPDPQMKENYLAAAEMDDEQNYNQIDGIINNVKRDKEKPSIRSQLRQFQPDTTHDNHDKKLDIPRLGSER